MGMAVCYEEMNRSIFGPVVFNSAAPDDGNMMVLEKLGTEAQKARWLAPIVDGEVRSAFAMTEPHPGGGSDPGMMRTTATREGDKYVIRGPQVVHHRRRGARRISSWSPAPPTIRGGA
jgi:acyl-CoA dehydrogenase